MPKTKDPLNSVGLWLIVELAKRNTSLQDFAVRAGTTPQYLSWVIRGQNITGETQESWRAKFYAALESLDAEQNERSKTLCHTST